MEINRCNAIWVGGSREGVKSLLEQLFLRLKDMGGTDAVVALKREVLELRLPSSLDPFILIRDESGFYIVPPSKMTAGATIWNEQLIHLHEDVIVPIKDKIGGVATGIRQLPDEGFGTS